MPDFSSRFRKPHTKKVIVNKFNLTFNRLKSKRTIALGSFIPC